MPRYHLFVLMFVSQAEFNRQEFLRTKMRIATLLRRSAGVLIVVRETGHIYVPEGVMYTMQSHGIYSLAFTNPRNVTPEMMRESIIAGTIGEYREDPSMNYVARSTTISPNLRTRVSTSMEIAL